MNTFSSITTNEGSSICCSLVNGFPISGSTLENPSTLPSEFQSLSQESASSEAPLGLDEPNTVWCPGVLWQNFFGDWTHDGWSILTLTEAEAWELRGRRSAQIKHIKRDPKCGIFQRAIEIAKRDAHAGIAIVNGAGCVIEEYPL